MILPETKICITKAVEMEKKNINKNNFIHNFNTEYTDLLDEVKTLQLVKKSLLTIAEENNKRSYIYALHSAAITSRHILAEATQLAAVVSKELESLEGADNERQ